MLEGEDDGDARRRLMEVRGATRSLKTTYDVRRRGRLERVIKSDGTWEEVTHVDPSNAMYRLLKHLKLDPDGGILNIVGSTEQANKLGALRKDKLEMGLAVMAAVRAVGNPAAMLYFATRLLDGYFFDEEFKMRFSRHCDKIRLSIPLEQLYLICAVMEVSVATFSILRALYHGLRAYFYDRCAGNDSTTNSGMSYKYMYVSEFYLRDIPALQNLSALRLLSFAHPNLIAKNAKLFSSKNEVARRILEKFMNKEPDTCSDEQLSEEMAGLIVQHDCKTSLEEEDKMAQAMAQANELVDLPPYDILMEFQTSGARGDRDFLVQRGCKPDVIDNLRGLHLFTALERLAFGLTAALCALCGLIEFFTKVCRLSFLLTNPTVPWWVSASFFLFLVNQCMGMNSIQQLLRWRVETFIFGGSDAVVSAEERYTMDVYLAVLMDKVWNNSRLRFLDKMAIMLQLDDDDLQQLVVEERERHKGVIASSVRKWMHEHARGGFQDKFVDWVTR